MQTSTKDRLLSAINTVVPLSDYKADDYLFSGKYPLSASDMVYVLLHLAKDFCFTINDDFIAAMENTTFSQFEALLVRYENTNAA